MRTYGRLLRRPSTSLSLVAALLSAVPIGMWPLVVVLLGLAQGGPAAAGSAAAVLGAGNAVGVLVQGALLTRVRAAVLLPVCALLGVPAAVLLQGDGPTALVGAALAGLAIPAVTPAVRGRFAAVLPPDDRPGAYALVNVLFQVGIAIGPLLAAALATAGAVRIAPVVAAALGLAAAGLLALVHRSGLAGSAAVRPSSPARGSRTGIAVLVAASVGAGFGIGVLQVLVPVRSGAAVAGATFAVLALAEVGAAVLLGSRVRAATAPAMLVTGSAVMAAAYLLVASGAAPVVLLAAALGVVTAAQSLGSALLLDRFVAAARLPAVFAAQIAALVLASSCGAFVAGRDPAGAAVVAAVLLTGAALGAAAVLIRLPGRPAVGR